MGQKSGFDAVLAIQQKPSGANTTQRISRFGAGVSTVFSESRASTVLSLLPPWFSTVVSIVVFHRGFPPCFHSVSTVFFYRFFNVFSFLCRFDKCFQFFRFTISTVSVNIFHFSHATFEHVQSFHTLFATHMAQDICWLHIKRSFIILRGTSHALTHGTRSICTPSSPSCPILAPRPRIHYLLKSVTVILNYLFPQVMRPTGSSTTRSLMTGRV